MDTNNNQDRNMKEMDSIADISNIAVDVEEQQQRHIVLQEPEIFEPKAIQSIEVTSSAPAEHTPQQPQFIVLKTNNNNNNEPDNKNKIERSQNKKRRHSACFTPTPHKTYLRKPRRSSILRPALLDDDHMLAMPAPSAQYQHRPNKRMRLEAEDDGSLADDESEELPTSPRKANIDSMLIDASVDINNNNSNNDNSNISELTPVPSNGEMPATSTTADQQHQQQQEQQQQEAKTVEVSVSSVIKQPKVFVPKKTATKPTVAVAPKIHTTNRLKRPAPSADNDSTSNVVPNKKPALTTTSQFAKPAAGTVVSKRPILKGKSVVKQPKKAIPEPAASASASAAAAPATSTPVKPYNLNLTIPNEFHFQTEQRAIAPSPLRAKKSMATRAEQTTADIGQQQQQQTATARAAPTTTKQQLKRPATATATASTSTLKSKTAKPSTTNTFKALPLNKKILESAGDLGVPRIISKPTTSAKPFNFASDALKAKKQSSASQESAENEKNVTSSSAKKINEPKKTATKPSLLANPTKKRSLSGSSKIVIANDNKQEDNKATAPVVNANNEAHNEQENKQAPSTTAKKVLPPTKIPTFGQKKAGTAGASAASKKKQPLSSLNNSKLNSSSSSLTSAPIIR